MHIFKMFVWFPDICKMKLNSCCVCTQTNYHLLSHYISVPLKCLILRVAWMGTDSFLGTPTEFIQTLRQAEPGCELLLIT